MSIVNLRTIVDLLDNVAEGHRSVTSGGRIDTISAAHAEECVLSGKTTSEAADDEGVVEEIVVAVHNGHDSHLTVLVPNQFSQIAQSSDAPGYRSFSAKRWSSIR